MSFKHFYKATFTEIEVETHLETLKESRWWGKFKEEASIVEYETEDKKKRKLKAWRMEEDGASPTYVVEARKGLRYGLYRTTEGKFICARLKPGRKNIIKPKGIFKEVDGKLVFETTISIQKSPNRVFKPSMPHKNRQPPIIKIKEDAHEEMEQGITSYLTSVLNFDHIKVENWWTTTDLEDIGIFWSEKVKPWLSQQTVDENRTKA